LVKFLSVSKVLKLSAAFGVAIGVLLAAIPYVLPPIAEDFAHAKLSRLGIPADVRCGLGYCWTSTGPGLRAIVKATVVDTPWVIAADLTASPFQWHVSVNMPPVSFDDQDRLLARLLEACPMKAVSNLAFSGSVALEASADRTFSFPLPRWKVQAKLDNLCASAVVNKTPVNMDGLTLSATASGIADHVDIPPLRPHVQSILYGNVSMSNLVASIRVTDKRSLVIDSATAQLWNGSVSLYAVYFNPKTRNLSCTLFVDDVCAGEAMNCLSGFAGDASGRLHGKIKIRLLEDGAALVLREAFLYSVPGETGKLRIADPESMTDTLQLSGLDLDNRKNIANALTDLDYTVLKLDLKRNNGSDAALNLRLEGSATRNGVTVPVVLEVTLHGAIEQFINTSLKLNKKTKQGKLK